MPVPSPDYTEQLKAIAVAVNHPTTPMWIPIVLSSFFGMVGGVLVQVFKRLLDERSQRNRMRKALYTDLGGYFIFVFSIFTDRHYSGVNKEKWQQEQFELRINFSIEDFLRKQADMYIQLPEYLAANELYVWLHSTVAKTENHVSNPGFYCQIFSEYVREGALAEKCFEKYCGKDYTARLMAKVLEVRKMEEQAKKAIVDGHLRVVDGFLVDQKPDAP
jgi:hypothetical protein